MVQRTLVAVALATLTGCGGRRAPTAPSSPTPPPGWAAGTTMTVISGETGEPVAEAEVHVGSTPAARTDGRGQLALGASVPAGTPVTIVADGFLRRETLVRAGDTTFILWLSNGWMPEGYTWQLVYLDALYRTESPLRRLASGVRTVSVKAGAEMRGDRSAMNVLGTAVDMINAPLDGRVVYALDAPAADVTVIASFNPGHSWCGLGFSSFTTLGLDSTSTIRSATMVFCSVTPLHSEAAVEHELGHTYGLQHTDDWNDVMYVFSRSGGPRRFTSRESLTMKLMAERRPGNRWPDNDTTATASSGLHYVTLE